MTHTRVAIFGVGQTGNMVRSILSLSDSVEVAGFVDDDESTWGREEYGLPVFGGRDSLSSLPVDATIVALGSIGARRTLAEWLAGAAIPQVSAIHPSALIPRETVVGSGSIIGSGVTMYVNPQIGRNVFVGPHVVISHDSFVEDFALVSVGSIVGARVDVRTEAMIGAGATVQPPGWGASARLEVGPRAVVGVGAVVITDVPPDTTVVGVPARPVLRRHK